MSKKSLDLIKIDEHERKAIFARCSRSVVGFLSKSDETFYGSGIIIVIEGTWTILSAAHVITAAKNRDDCKIFFSNDHSSDVEYAASVRDYNEILSRVSNARRGRDWNITDLDIGIIIPAPSVFEGLNNLIPIEIPSGEIGITYTSEIALVWGFPKRLQTERKDLGITSNPIFTQFLPNPLSAREDDISLNWEKIFQVTTNKLENAPCAGGMSGGPIYSYIRDSVDGTWTVDKQMFFSGFLHYQYSTENKDENCLLGHNLQVVKDFISILLNGWGRDDFREALLKGYRP